MLRIAVRYANQALFFSPRSEVATLGASEENDFVVPFPGISRRHAQFARRPGGLWISDLGSKNGLQRGDQRHAELLLAPGETIRIGKASVGLEEISSSDADITLILPPPKGGHATRGVRGLHGSTGGQADPRLAARRSSDTDPLFETGGQATPGSALALVRRIETSSRLELGSATTADLMERARQTLGADLLLVYAPTADHAEPAIEAIAGPVHAGAPLCPVALESITVPGDGLPIVALAEGRLALARRLPRKPQDLILAAVLPPRSGKPAGWKLDFFDYLAEKLVPAHRKPATPPAPARRGAAIGNGGIGGIGANGGADSDPLRFPTELVHGGSVAMEKLFHHLRATVQSTMDVLLLGETGTGKELIARLVHASGYTARGPFLAINCAAIPAELLEVELFGVEARVATGVDPRPGLFAKAEGGTLFLDEIGDMAERLQAKLLRVLQEREVLPVGAHHPRKIKVRVISASNQKLAQRVEAGTFRADLYYRLRGLQFHLPPLRERKEDLPALVLAFAHEAAHRYQKEIHGVSRRALDLLTAYEWPGNVRELKNEVDRAVLLATEGGHLEGDHFGPVKYAVEHRRAESESNDPAIAAESAQVPEATAQGALHGRVDAVEREAILEALRSTLGNKSKAAQLLGITRNGLALKMKRLHVGRDDVFVL